MKKLEKYVGIVWNSQGVKYDTLGGVKYDTLGGVKYGTLITDYYY